jgi:hypothetical protein
MAVYNLTGAGVVGLSSNVDRILVDVQLFTSDDRIGRATPPNYYDLGLLRWGVQGSYGPTLPIDSASMFLDAPAGVTSLGYSLFGTTAIRVTEQFAEPAAGGTHVSGLSYANTLTTAQGQIQLVSYTVPASRSALLEAVFLGVNLGTNPNEVVLAIYFNGALIEYDLIVGPMNDAATGAVWSSPASLAPIRMNAGEQLLLEGGNVAGSSAIQFLASAIVLEYPQPMW